METSLVASSQIFPSQMSVQHLAVTASHLELPLFIEGKWNWQDSQHEVPPAIPCEGLRKYVAHEPAGNYRWVEDAVEQNQPSRQRCHHNSLVEQLFLNKSLNNRDYFQRFADAWHPNKREV